MCTNINSDRMLKHLFDGSDFNVYDKNFVNLGVGAPGPDILTECCEIFDKATSHRMKAEICEQGMLFQYGPAVGIYEARSEIVKFLTSSYRCDVSRENLILTTGATQGLHIIISTLIDMNGFIFIDEVTYMIALEVFKQFTSMKVIPVKLNNDGIDIEELRTLLKEKQFKSESKVYWGMYYAIPTYHNPTGIVFSDAVCKKLIELAREFDILVACDDVYNTLYYGDKDPPKRLFAYDDINDEGFKGNVISIGTFSKIIAPGIRFGWLEVPARCKTVLEPSGILQSGGALNNYTSGIMASLFELGFAQSHAAFAKELYRKRMLTTIEILKHNLPESCHFVEPQGGYFIWIQMPENIDANVLLEKSLKIHKVYFIPGNRFSIDGKFNNYFRLSIAFHTENVLIESVPKICNCIKELLNEKN